MSRLYLLHKVVVVVVVDIGPFLREWKATWVADYLFVSIFQRIMKKNII